MKILAYDPRKAKYVLVGRLVRGTLTRQVESKHYMRIVDGYGIQEHAFQEILNKKTKYIIQEVKETKDKWKSSVKDWIKHGHVADYGHGKQRFLSLKYMTKIKETEQLFPIEVNVDTNKLREAMERNGVKL